jgi:hypothetical protein
MEESTPLKPARRYYTPQEIADLALSWGAFATVVSEDDNVFIELEHGDESFTLDFGPTDQFHEDMLCRGWLYVPSSPHRLCDEWNRFPYMGTFSLVYDDNGLPMKTEAGFVVRKVEVIQFRHAASEDDVFLQVLSSWFGIKLLQHLINRGSTDLDEIDQKTVGGDIISWWFGTDEASDE